MSNKFGLLILLLLSFFFSTLLCSSFPRKPRLVRQTNSPRTQRSLLDNVKTLKFEDAWNIYLKGNKVPLLDLIEKNKYDPNILVDRVHNLMQAALRKGDRGLVKVLLNTPRIDVAGSLRSGLKRSSTMTDIEPAIHPKSVRDQEIASRETMENELREKRRLRARDARKIVKDNGKKKGK